MTLASLVWHYLKAKPLNTLLNIFLMGLGVAVITILLLLGNQLQEKITDNARGIDLVVGAKGSPLQLILCNIFHVDFPTGNIKLNEAERIAGHRMVKRVIPLALGDSYQNFRIVGTNAGYPELYEARLAQGQWWAKPLEAVVGATAASLTGLKIGDTFASAHGLGADGHAHEAAPYIVTGILQPSNTVMDNLILTGIESVWMVHDEGTSNTNAGSTRELSNPSSLVPSVAAGDSTKEITAMLMTYRNPIAAIQLPRYINSQSNLQAASPAFETARLFSILGVGVDVLTGFAYVLIFISTLSIFIALYNSLKERQYDLAIMRAMGASRTRLFLSVIMEGTTLTFAGSVLGLILGHLAVHSFTLVSAESRQTGFSALAFYPEEYVLLMASALIGLVCSLLPAFQAYRTDIHKVLANG
jgi:putative ABC transport system permease protein